MSSRRLLLLDTQVVDALIDDDVLRRRIDDAARADTVEVLVTHLQIEETLEMPATKVDAQEALLQTLAELVATRVATAGAVWDRSRWDEATLMSARRMPRRSSYTEVATTGTPRTCCSL